MLSKICYKCKRDLPASNFIPTQLRKKSGECRACFNKYMRDYRANNRARMSLLGRRSATRRKLRLYGAYSDDIDVILRDQESRCAACRRVLDLDADRDFHIDHDHVTMKFRGVLCYGCNRAAGLLRDDPAAARGLADYLERYASAPGLDVRAVQSAPDRYC